MREVGHYVPALSPVKKAIRVLQKFWRMVGGRAVILMYHRITAAEFDPYNLRVTPDSFVKQLQMIREIGRPTRLVDLAQSILERKMPDRAVCVTFDDGYADSLHTAKALLERYDVPATVFVTTGPEGRSREFWWDELERVFLKPGELPDRLHLNVRDRQFEWDLGDWASFSEKDVEHHLAWKMPDPDSNGPQSHPTERHNVLFKIYRLIRELNQIERCQTMDRLLESAGVNPVVRTTHRALTLDEVAELERGGLVEVGAHTVNHLDLSTVSAKIQIEQIRRNKVDLERCVGHPLKSFAYPYGLYSDASVAAVRQAGFKHACTCSFRAVKWCSDVFKLPRVAVFDLNCEDFDQCLRHHFRY